MRYVNLDLVLVQAGERYRLSVRTESGQTGDALWLELAALAPAFNADLDRLKGTDGDEEYYRDLGERLFQVLFVGDVAKAFDQEIKLQRAMGGGVCVRLRFDDAQARALPWEFMFRPDWGAFLGASIESPLVRYLDVPRPIREFQVALPLRMLVLAPQSAKVSRAGALDSSREIDGLRETMRDLDDLVQLTVLDTDVRFDRVSEVLITERFHIVHFIGHGSFIDDVARLRLDRAGGGEEPVDERRWSGMFANQPSVKLVFLNACESAAVSTLQAVHGLAPRLIEIGVPAVVAMQYEVQDEAAIEFSKQFYCSLFKGVDRGRVDVAMSHARSKLVGDYRDQREIGAPVLYLRAPAGLLFDSPAPGADSKLLIKPVDAPRALAVERTLASNVALGAEGDRPALAQVRMAFVRSNLFNLTVALALLLVVVGGSWVEAINFEIKTAIVGLRELIAPVELIPELRIVELDEGSEERLGKKFNPQSDWRGDFALLIDRLSLAGARTIAFNFNLRGPKASDAALIRAIQDAVGRGTAVVFSPSNVGDDPALPNLHPAFLTAGAIWGSSCFQRKDFQYATSLSIAATVDAGNRRPRPAFGLTAAFPDYSITGIAFTDRVLIMERPGDPNARRIRFSEAGEAEADKGCSLIRKGARTADLFVEFPSPAHFSERRAALHEVASRQGPAPDLRRYRGAIVVVGEALKTESSPGEPARPATKRLPAPHVGGTDLLFPAAFHAAVINTLIRGVVIAPLSPVLQALVALGLAVLAAIWRLCGPGSARRVSAIGHDAIALFLIVMSSLTAACVIYFLDYRYFSILNVVVMAMIGYALADRLQARWLAPSGSAVLEKTEPRP